MQWSHAPTRHTSRRVTCALASPQKNEREEKTHTNEQPASAILLVSLNITRVVSSFVGAIHFKEHNRAHCSSRTCTEIDLFVHKMRSATYKFILVGLSLFPLAVKGFSLVSLQTTFGDAKQISAVPWTQSVTGHLLSQLPTAIFAESTSTTTTTTRNSSTLTKTQVAAWCLSQQLLFVLKREELSIEEEDGQKNVAQMIRWLNTRLLFGCTALEYVEQAVAAREESSYDAITMSQQDQNKLDAMLDFTEFDSPYLDDEDENFGYYEEEEDFAVLDDEALDTAEPFDGKDESDEDDFSDLSSISRALEDELLESQEQFVLQEEPEQNADTPSVYNYGRPLEIVQSNVPPLQTPINVNSMVSGSDEVSTGDDENKDEETITPDVAAVDKVESMAAEESDYSVPTTTTAAPELDDKPVMDSSSNTISQSSVATPLGEDDKAGAEATMDMNVSTNTLVELVPTDTQSNGVNENTAQHRVEPFLTVEKYENHETLESEELELQIVNGTTNGNFFAEPKLTTRSEETEAAVVQDESVANEAKTTSYQARLYKASALIAHSFETKEFSPPFWTRNGNVQTIASFLARENNPTLTEFKWDERQRMETPDGDFFVVDWKYSDLDENVGRPSSEVPLVLLCHGLESNSDSYLAKDMARAFINVGMDVACINFRGCSDEINRGPVGYHLGFTDDLKFMVEHVMESRRGSRLYLSGFSLGANVVTKLLAEWGTDAFSKYNIRGAAVNALPFDFTKIGPNFCSGLTKSLYGDGLLKSLQNRVLLNYDSQNYSFSKDELMNCKTVREFDDLVVCDVYDFDGVDDYHRKCSTVSVLDQVAVPELVIQALDDPFFEGNTNPPNNASQPLRIQYTQHGGHCGYWQNEEPGPEPTWMPLQLARFLKHVDEQQSSLYELYGVVPKDQPYTDGVTKQSSGLGRLRAAQLSHSFIVRDYNPSSYATNSHLQTVMGALYRKESMYASPDLLSFVSEIPKLNDKLKGGAFQWDEFKWDRRQRFETSDNDFFDVDWKTSGLDFASDDTPLVIICHGLQASSDSPLVKDMAEAFLNHGMGAACINFRGCSGEVNRTPRGYHLGFTEDLLQLVLHVNKVHPNKRIYLSAFSLGANVMTNFLADLGNDAAKYNIAGAAVNALPYEVSKSTMNLNSDGLTKTLYADRILESMYVRVEEMFDNGVEFGFEREKIRECKTIMDMENLVVAPFFDFEDAWDYYDKTSTLPRLDEVAVPELVIQSEDDPFLLGQTPIENKAERPLRIHYTKHGGHCGHVFHCTDQAYPTSWMPTELARFLAHVDLSLKSDPVTLAKAQNQNTEKEILN